MKTKALVRLLVVGGAVWAALLADPAQAQTLELTLSTTSIAFASADPDTTPSIPAAAVTLTYRIRGAGNISYRITLVASDDLNSGAATIPISLVTWTATPAPPFQNGTMSRTAAQTLASGVSNSQGVRTGQVVFSLENRWTHNPGIYTTSVAFTLVAP
jgi:hypothetical protein